MSAHLKAERDALFHGRLLGIARVSGGVFVEVNEAFARIWGRPAAAIAGTRAAALSAETSAPLPLVYERDYVRPDGAVRRLRVDGVVVDAASDMQLYSVADITAQEAALTQAREALAHAVDVMGDGFALFGPDDRLVVCNQVYASMLEGFDSARAMIGLHVEDLIRMQIGHGQPVPAEHTADIDAWIAQSLAVHRHADGVPQIQHLSDGRWVQSIRHRTPDGGIVVLRSDITAQKTREQVANQLAQHDPLTGLPNRRLLHDRLTQALARASRASRRVAVLAIDLDEFKPVNDTWGHRIGDDVLRVVGSKLVQCLRVTDTVARVGGDEFIAIIDGLGDPAYATAVAEKIIEVIGQPMAEGDALPGVRVGCSVGVSLYPDDGTDLDTLIRLADSAMYRAKQAGRGRAVRVQ